MHLSTKSVIKYTLSFIAAAILVYFAFRKVDWSAFWTGLTMTRWSWMAAYAGFSVLALLFRCLRWHSLLHPLDPQVGRLPIWDANNIGNLVNIVLPSVGEFTRCGIVATKRATYDKTFGTIACERLSDVIALIVLLIATLLLDHGSFRTFFHDHIWVPLAGNMSLSLGWLVVGFILLLATFIAIVFIFRDKNRACGKAAGALAGLGTGFVSITKMKHKELFILWTALLWSMYFMMSFCVLKAAPATASLPLIAALIITVVGNIASVIPVPGGIGAYHFLVALIIQTIYGLSWDDGILYATLYHESHAIIVMILGLFSYCAYSIRKKSSDKLSNGRNITS